jgi:pimeloyl-ACP methyl ester carboxylesterase
MPYAEINDRRLFYAQAHSSIPAAPTIVLIHGAGGSHLLWPAELRRLPEATVFALDLPGHGRSAAPACTTIEGYVAALIDFLDATETDRAVLAGHSMGGGIALLSALTYSERVAGLVLIGTGARLRVAPAVLEGIKTDFEGTLDLITHFAWAESTPKTLAQRGRQTMAETSPDVILGDFLACDAFDLMERLNEISAPALVIAATADHLTPHKYGAYLAEHLLNAQLVTLEASGHMMALEQPVEVAEAVSAFIRQLA